jgi:hypothetical protein
VLGKILPAIGALALLLSAGMGLQLLLPAPLERSWSSRLGFAYLLGVGWVGLGAWTMAQLFGVPVTATLFAGLVALALFLGAGGLLLRRGDLGGWRTSTAGVRGGRWPLSPAAVLVTVAALALLADASANPVIDFDGRMTWGTQARHLRAAASVHPGVLLDESVYVIHPRYPILLPLAQVAVVELAGEPFDGYAVRPLYALFLPALFAVAWPTLVRAGGSRAAGLAAVLLFASPVLLWNPDGGARGSYSDLPLAAFLGGGLALLLHPRLAREPWRGAVAGLLLAAAVGAKNEGLVLAVGSVLLAAALAARRARRSSRERRRSRAFGVAALVVTAAVTLVLAWRAPIPNRNDEAYFEDFRPAAVATGLRERAPAIARAMVAGAAERRDWGWLFWLAPALLLVGARGLRGRAVALAAGVVALQLAMVTAAYAVVGDFSIVEVTWSRFLIQLALPLGILFSAATRGALSSARIARRSA